MAHVMKSRGYGSSYSCSRSAEYTALDEYLGIIIATLPKSDVTDLISACNWDARYEAKHVLDTGNVSSSDYNYGLSSADEQMVEGSLQAVYKMLPVEHLNLLLTCPTSFVRHTVAKYKKCSEESK